MLLTKCWRQVGVGGVNHFGLKRFEPLKMIVENSLLHYCRRYTLDREFEDSCLESIVSADTIVNFR